MAGNPGHFFWLALFYRLALLYRYPSCPSELFVKRLSVSCLVCGSLIIECAGFYRLVIREISNYGIKTCQ